MRLTFNLLPLLKAARAPRVLSVLIGGNERPIIIHDLGLEQNYTIINVVNHTTTMHTLAFEHIAMSNPSISFLHANPGLVRTDILANLFTPQSGKLYGFLFILARWVAALVLMLFGISAEESGERQAFHATSARYPSRSILEVRRLDPKEAAGESVMKCSAPRNGVYLVDWMGEGVLNTKVLGPYRDEGLPEKIWDHTVNVFDRALAR